jgi:Ca2+/Na+ antiporter
VGYLAGDPILLTRNPRRFKTFYYCNSVAFVASLVAIILVRQKTLHRHNALEAAMILDLFGLIGAYAAGSCRDVQTSIYAMALAGVVLVYVVLHVVFFTLDHEDDTARVYDEAFLRKQKEQNELVEKRRKRLLLFAILAATITYQAGLTPPSGFRLQDDSPPRGHRAGDPVLLYNSERRYKAFFYCNSVSFMLSIALIILLVNKNLYRPAIRSNALSVCTAAGMFGLVGAYAAGSTQHFKTSIYIFVLAAFVLAFVAALVLVFRKGQQGASAPNRAEQSSASSEGNSQQADPENGTNNAEPGTENDEKKTHAKRKYLMLLGILVASVTYQAGLDPPGGVWQRDDSIVGHAAGNPIMHDNRRPRYLAFFYSNSTSFVASVVVIILLLPEKLHKRTWWLTVMNNTVRLDLLGLLVAYAAGSSRSWKTSGYVSALVIAVLGYFLIHVLLSFFSRFCKKDLAVASSASLPNAEVVELQQAQRV